MKKNKGACRLFRYEFCVACGIDRCSKYKKNPINIYKLVSREAEFRARWNSTGGGMFSVRAEPTVIRFGGNYVASVGPLAPESPPGLGATIGPLFVADPRT